MIIGPGTAGYFAVVLEEDAAEAVTTLVVGDETKFLPRSDVAVGIEGGGGGLAWCECVDTVCDEVVMAEGAGCLADVGSGSDFATTVFKAPRVCWGGCDISAFGTGVDVLAAGAREDPACHLPFSAEV